MFRLFCGNSFGYVVQALVCGLAFVIFPIQPMPAQVCVESDCEDSCWGWGRTFLVIAGAAVVGGIAGAAAGSSHNHHGHSGSSGSCGEIGPRGPRGFAGPRGRRGPQGEVGPSPFTPDLGESLTFTPGISLGTGAGVGDIPALTTLTMTPFVSTPDGNTLVGDSIPFIGPITLASLITFDPLVVDDPVFGTYEVGVEIAITGAGPVVLTGLTAQSTVDATRGAGSTTTVSSSSGLTGIPVLTPASEQIQVSASFTYAQEPVP